MLLVCRDGAPSQAGGQTQEESVLQALAVDAWGNVLDKRVLNSKGIVIAQRRQSRCVLAVGDPRELPSEAPPTHLLLPERPLTGGTVCPATLKKLKMQTLLEENTCKLSPPVPTLPIALVIR